MNTKILLLCTITGVCFASICMAQEENTATGEQDTPVIYVLDGERTSFAYGRVTAPNKIAIGLTDEGIYELHGDTAVWLVNHPGREDEPVCRIIDDFMTGNKLFVLITPGTDPVVMDTVCTYNPGINAILDKAGNHTGTIKHEGTIVSPQGKTLLLNLQSVDELLAVFFFAYHYTPVRKQLQFSHFNTIQNFYINKRSFLYTKFLYTKL